MSQDATAEEIVYTCGTPDFVDKRRRKPGTPKKSFEPQQMWDRYQEIARLIFLGKKNVEIANDVGVTPECVSYIRNSELVQQKLSSLHQRADDEVVSVAPRVKELAPKALDVLEEVIGGKVGGQVVPINIQASTAKDLLDRAGFAAPKEVRNLNLHGHFTSEDIERFKERAAKSAIESAQVIVVDEEDS